MVGESSGPKFGVNLKVLGEALGASFITSNAELGDPTPRYGWYADQRALSPAVHQWVALRKKMIKRPFLATLEKYVNPFGADVFVGSAFHSTFVEKGLGLAERLGYRAAILAFKTSEGTTGLSLVRRPSFHLAARRSSGSWNRTVMTLTAEALGFSTEPDEENLTPKAGDNAHLIRSSLENGTSGNLNFDRRAAFTKAAYSRALDWVTERLGS